MAAHGLDVLHASIHSDGHIQCDRSLDVRLDRERRIDRIHLILELGFLYLASHPDALRDRFAAALRRNATQHSGYPAHDSTRDSTRDPFDRTGRTQRSIPAVETERNDQ